MRSREFIAEADIIDFDKARKERELKAQQSAEKPAAGPERDDLDDLSSISYGDRELDSMDQDSINLFRTLKQHAKKPLRIIGLPNATVDSIVTYLKELSVPTAKTKFVSWYNSLEPDIRRRIVGIFGTKQNITVITDAVTKLINIVIQEYEPMIFNSETSYGKKQAAKMIAAGYEQADVGRKLELLNKELGILDDAVDAAGLDPSELDAEADVIFFLYDQYLTLKKVKMLDDAVTKLVSKR
jgi:hypothetical protein